MLCWLSTSDWINAAVAIGTIGLAVAAFWQVVREIRTRPDLTLETDEQGVQSRLEAPQNLQPWLRLMVRNADRRRTAKGTRVIVSAFRVRGDASASVSLAGPELGWPSTEVPEGAGAVVFGGTARPVDFGALGIVHHGSPPSNMKHHAGLPEDGEWCFRFTLAMHAPRAGHQGRAIGREFLPPRPNGYTATLIVGADEGEARAFDVDFNWSGDAATPQAALDSFELLVRRARAHRAGP